MKVIVIAYAAKNLGDDMFLLKLAQCRPQHQFYVLATAKADIGAAGELENIQTITDSIYNHTTDFDALVVIGGSMFQKFPGWWRQWARYLLRFLRAKRLAIPIYVIGASFGPATNHIYLLAYRSLFRICRGVSVRDKQSAKRLRRIGSVEWHPDLLFASPLVQRTSSSGSSVGISVMEFGAARMIPGYTATIVAIARNLIASGRSIKLIGFQDTASISDFRAIRRVTDLLTPEELCYIDTYCYDGSNIRTIIEAISECSEIIGTRFHSVVFGLAMGKKVASISYHAKTQETIESLGARIPQLTGFTAPAVDAFLNELASAEPPSSDTLNLWRAEAEKHLNRFDSDTLDKI